MESKKKLFILTFIFLFSIIGIVLIPNSFSALQPIKSVEMFSKNTDFTKKEAGAWKVTKSAKWLGKGEAEITVDVDTIMKTGNKYSDVLLVVDNSKMLEGEKFTKVKEATTELVNNLLVNGENRVGLITFNSSSEIVSDFTNDIVNLTVKINDLSTTGSTSYYRALENVDKILKEYQREENRECKVVFITTTNPSLDIPNEVAYYEYLKKQYPFITIKGIQYEMGNIVIDSIRRITDNQYLANKKNLNSILSEASASSLAYDKFIITDFIDTNYFNVGSENDINVTKGKVTLDKEKQTLTWNMDNLKSGNTAKMIVKAKLKEDLTTSLYPTNTKMHTESRIGDITEDEESTRAPILANNYRVIYDGSAPVDCSVEDLPEAESKAVSETVGISNIIPKCVGYKFKGWKLITKDVTTINDDYFMMPEEDVVFKATWGKVAVKKLMDGEVSSASSDLEKGEIILDLSKDPTETLDVTKIENVSYEIADENIISVSEDGTITGKNIGSTRLTVRGDNDYLKEYKIDVQKTVNVRYEKQGIGVTGITKTKDSCLITKSGESCKVVAPKMTVLTGYEVVGWNTDKESRTGIMSGKTITLSEDATYYAIFYKEAATYSVEFNANGNTISDTKKSCSIDRVYNGSTEGINCSVRTPEITAPSATPTIVGYNENQNGTTSQIGSNETLVLNEANTGKTYYAITRKDEVTYTNYFNVNGNTTDAPSKSCTLSATYNGKAQATSCDITTPIITAPSATPTIIGYNEDKNAITSQIGSKETITLDSTNTGKTYYAITKKDGVIYTVNFNANGNSISAISKSCSIEATYNGMVQATSCNVTTPVITAPSATPTIIGYNQTASATSAQVGSNAILTLNSAVNGKTYYAITRKDSFSRSITYTKGTGVSSTGKSGDFCTISATYNGTAQGTTCSVTLPSITALTGYQDAGFYTSSAGSGTKYTASSSYTLSGNATLYAVAKRNFTCAAAGSTTTYAGKNWYTVANDGTNCTLALNTISSSTGTYTEATSKLTSEYFTSGSTLLNEKNAGLTTVLGTYTGATSLSGSGIIWTGSSSASAYGGKTMPYYSDRTTFLYYGNVKYNDGTIGTPPSANLVTSYNTGYTSSCNSVSGSNCVITNGVISNTGNITNHGSGRYTYLYFKSTSEGSASTFNMYHTNYPANTTYNFNQYRLEMLPCGGTYHNSVAYRVTAASATTVTNYAASTGGTSTLAKASKHKWYISGVNSSTYVKNNNLVYRTYNASSDTSICVPTYTYSYQNAYYSINYRLYIKVKM